MKKKLKGNTLGKTFPGAIKILLKMKLTLCVILISFLGAMASESYSQTTKFSLDLKNVKVKDALGAIENQSAFFFLYSEKLIDVNREVDIEVRGSTIEKILDKIFEGTNVNYTVKGRQIVLATPANNVVGTSSVSQQQQKKVMGKVTNSSGTSLPGVSVVVKGTTTGVITDNEGNYSLANIPENATLQFSFVGMKMQEIVVADKTAINLVMEDEIIKVEEVVVVGYGTTKKSDLTGAIASVKGAQLTRLATVDPVQALQGRIAGVEITSNSGQPGSGTRVRIRGVGTINNSNPLYVVDGFQSENIAFLMPGDIESIEILKDASATAIYGSRGANGVILVTTKKGKAGKTKFSFNGYAGVQKVWKKIDVTNAEGYATLISEAYQNEGQQVPANIADRIQNAIKAHASGTDWQDEITQIGMINNYNLAVSGGTEQNRYLISGGYFQQDGTVKSTSLKKYVIRLNDELILTKNIKAGISANFTRTGNLGYSNIIRGAVLANPISTPFTSTGEFGYNDIENATNVVRMIDDQKYNKTENNNLFSNAYIDVKLFSGFSFRSDFGISYNNIHGKPYLPQYFVGLNDQRSISSLAEDRSETVRWVLSNYVNYNKKFGSDHSLSATLGQEIQRKYGNGISITAYDVPRDASLQYISASRSLNSNFTSTQSDEELHSFFTRANYDYKSRFLLTATLRYDGSSKFLQDVRWGLFPSFGAAWKISNENFLKNINDISSLKIRAGWGQVGNQNAAPNYGYVSTARNNMNYVFNNVIVPGMIPTQLSNPNLKWETTVSSNIGVDADMFNNRLSITADYFIKNTKDMIALLPIADYIGAAPASANVASMQNKGFEFSVNYRSTINKLHYDLGFNLTKINNKVTNLGGASPIASGNVISQMGNTTLTDVGYEIAYFYGLKTNGIFRSQDEINAFKNNIGALIQPNAKPGDVKFIDLNNDGKISSLDKTYLGSASSPDFSYGISLNLGYNNFDFKLLLFGVQGIEAVNGMSRYLLKTSNSTGSWNNFSTLRLNRWTPNNVNSNEPRMTTKDLNGNDQFSDRFVEDASYLRARNIEIGYTLPTKLLSKCKVNSLRFNLSIDNLFTLTKYSGFDPEISEAGNFGDPLSYGVDFGNYPQPRTFRLGLNLEF